MLTFHLLNSRMRTALLKPDMFGNFSVPFYLIISQSRESPAAIFGSLYFNLSLKKYFASGKDAV